MIVLDGADVRRLFSMREVIGIMEDAMRIFSDGAATQPPRTVIRGGKEGLFGVMPVQILEGAWPGFGVKTVVVKHDNAARGLPSHVGLVVVFDRLSGIPRAILDAATVTEIRTAAVSAVATDVLARPGGGDLAILGTGAQARAHLEAMAVVRPPRRVRVWGRTLERVESLRLWARQALSLELESAESPDSAALGADIICTTTSSREPLLGATAVREGTHINAVGACQPGARELATDLVTRASIFVDSRESALKEADDVRIPIQEGRMTEAAIVAEIGEVLLGRHRGRNSPDEITLYESVGLAVQDVALGFRLAARAEQEGVGRRVALGM
jgi:ornithine cyclodeaminase/alanine dehydrogenase-like protein (mu-crystallin family)